MVSIIVPVYNVQAYLEECLQSLLRQSYREIEIIVVDDGSTDGSSEIVKAYADKYKCVQAVYQKNSGLSGARNTGIERARGDYLCFVDSDDWVDETYVATLLNVAEQTEADMTVCGYIRENEGKSVQMIFDLCGNKTLSVTRVQAMKMLDNIFDIDNCLMTVAWNKIYRREIFQILRYPDRLHEDEFLIHRIIDQVKTVTLVAEALYHYRERNDAITGNAQKYNKRHLDLLLAHEDRIKICKKQDYKELYPNMILCYYEIMIQLMLRYRKEDFVQYHLNNLFRRRGLAVYLKCFKGLSNKYRIEYLHLIMNPWRYREIVLKVMKDNEER
ncbi:MAG: glycosyltransferase [Lachnospiraceae bacterium]|nr:glycosyltransferase [Lachnospiraceae bacterium]